MHEVLVNRLGGLSLPRKSVVRLTDRPDMTLDVYRGRKTTIQPTNDHSVTLHSDISLIINGSFIVARAFYAHVLCPRLDKMCMKIYANSRYKDKSAQTVVYQSKHSS